MNCSTPGFPACHYFTEFAQTHVDWVSGWYPTISSSIASFSSCPQSFPASGSFPMSQLFTSGGQHVGALASVLPKNIQGWFPIGLIDLTSIQSKGFSRVLSSITIQKHRFFIAEPSLWFSSHICTWLLEKTNTALTIQTFFSKVMSLLFNILSRFVIAFLPRSKHLLNSWLQSPSTVIWEPKEVRSIIVSTFSPSVYHEMMGQDVMIFVCWMLHFKPAIQSPLSPLSRGSLAPLQISAIRISLYFHEFLSVFN